MVIDGHNIKIDNNTIDAMNQFIQDDIQTSSEEEPRRQSRSRDDGTYDITTLHPDYFKNVLSKQTQNAFHLSRLWDNHTKESKFIKTQKHQKVQKLSKTFVETLTSNLTPSPPNT